MSTEAMKLALEALEGIHPGNMTPMAEEYWNTSITVLREALAHPQQEPAAWAISYDGETPYAIWPDGDGALLDIEVKRQGGTTCKLPLYTSPPARKPLTEPQKQALAENWFAEDWAITKAIGMMYDHEKMLGIKGDA